MTEEELQELKEKYELSLIKYQDAIQKRTKAKKQLEADEVAYSNSHNIVAASQENLIKNRREYEDAFYKFYEENNE